MATVSLSFETVMQGSAPVEAAYPQSVQNIISGGTSTASTIAAGNNTVAIVTVSGGDVYVAFGATPVASSTNGKLIGEGTTRSFGNIVPGHKMAVIDV